MSRIILHAWMHTPEAQALGWTLFHFLWEGAVIAAVLLAILFFCRRTSPHTRYAAACLALLAMPVAFALTFAIELPHGSTVRVVHNRVYLIDTAAAPAYGPAPVKSPTLGDRLQWAPPVWLAGVLVFFLYRAASWLAARRLCRVGTFPAPREWRERVDRLARMAGIGRTVALLESCLAGMPMVIGYLKPAILVPAGMLAGLPADQVEAILLHELAHIRRADYLVNLVQVAVESLLFYHPAAWWVSSVIRSERENCCDDWAAARHGDRHGYARALVRLEESPWRAPETALAATGGNLLRRIRRLLAGPGRELSVPTLPGALLVVFAAIALAAFTPNRPAQRAAKPTPPAIPAPLPSIAAAEPEPSPQRRPTSDAAPPPAVASEPTPAPSAEPAPADPPQETPKQNPYQKWLNEDVSYIIMPEERAAFRKLETDAEREKFIEQFWQRRDPTPGTELNEYKVEHYRRIAYANEHFALQLPGWKTLRGRTYIIYGPPDEITSQVAQFSIQSIEWETWRYKYIEGIGWDVRYLFTIRDGADTRRMISPTLATYTAETNGTPPLPGGAHATVNIHPAGLVDFVVPLQFQSKDVHVLGQVRTLTNRPVANFEDSLTAPNPNYSAQFTLLPGTYKITIGVIDKAGMQQYAETLTFTVQ